MTGHSDWVLSVAFSPDGLTILTGSADKTAILWDALTGRRLHTLTGHSRSVRCVAFSPDGNTALTGGADGSVILWDLRRNWWLSTTPRPNILSPPPGTGRPHEDSVQSVAFSPDGLTIATASTDKTVKLWDIERQAQLWVFDQHTASVQSVAFSPDGHKLLTGSADKTARLLDASVGTMIRAF